MNSLYEELVERSMDHMPGYLHHFYVFYHYHDNDFISFRKLDLTSKTSNICNILSPLYHAYFQQIDLAAFKVVKLYLILEFFCGFYCWTPGHGQEGPMKEGLSFHLSVCPIDRLSFCVSVSFLKIGSFVFFWNLVRVGIQGSWFVNHK